MPCVMTAGFEMSDCAGFKDRLRLSFYALRSNDCGGARWHKCANLVSCLGVRRVIGVNAKKDLKRLSCCQLL